MTIVRVQPHPLGLVVKALSPERSQVALGDSTGLILPGEECLGMSYEALERIANTTHVVDLPERER